MVKRDPARTLRNHKINEITQKITVMKDKVVELTGYANEQSLNAYYGSRYDKFIDLKNEVINTPEQFRALYFQGFLRKLEELGTYACNGNSYYDSFLHIKNHELVREWIILFLTRTYLRNYDSLSRKRPSIEESSIWIGQENASYGIFVTPRFSNGEWENDKSEVRHFKYKYWTIGHILCTGLVIPDEDEKINFNDINSYLSFFYNTLVRNSGSSHEREIAKRYCDFVKQSSNPLDVPLLIPELRYGGKIAKHEHRLDFTIIDPYTLSKVGFELSPWSTHGRIEKTKEKTQKQINAEALSNFEYEMLRLKSYFRGKGIPVLVYTDKDLSDYDAIFNEMSNYLMPSKKDNKLEFHAMSDFLAFTPLL
ncbi:topoisomerase [Pectobacterium versatile]|uniref:topoisomerase n=1 Tax=Pectobacterium versatile TaxID=2488639 RepID=UPI001F2B06C3|nr:topoisomerase [Pectobacterium versatile]